MGLTKQYLRYVPGPIFNVIASVHANAVFVQLRAQAGRYVAVAGCENALIWDTRTGEKVLTLAGEKDSATVLRAGPSGNHLAVGYDDGAIRLFDLMSGECLVTYSGHKSAVTCLQFDREGTRLVSGSKDTNLIVWDTVTEAGLFRLTGHKGPITQCRFFESRNLLVSSSKDALVKFWDLDAQHCFLTLPDHRSEVWDLVLLGADRFLVTGCSDSELRVWKIDFTDEQSSEEDQGPASEAKRPRTDATEGAANETESGDDSSLLRCTQFGTILRQGRDRLVSLALDAYGGLLACHGTDAIVELFRFHDADEVKKRLAKRQRKAKKKLLAAENGAPTTEPANQSDLALSLQDVMSRLPSIRASGKIKGLDLYRGRVDELKLAILLGNNGIEIHQVEAKEAPAAKKTLDGAAASLLTRVSAPGHRSDVRALAFSADNIAVASASGESLKIWNRSSQRCVRTMSCGYGLALVFAPGDRHVVVATKTGKLQVFDVASGRLLEETQAHEGEAWSVCLSPDLRGLASGGADKTLKFWQFELVADVVDEDSITGSSAKRLALHHTKTLQLEEDVLCVRYSPDQRLIAVAQLDSTVKIFFCDTLKFFLSLYGHKFPVLCMDISHDSSIIITAGADRNIKIWGLDFGDCHRSIFAHEDSIMGLQFVSKTHLFFSCSKDGLLKQWDADNFESVVTLTGHHGQIWTLAVSHDGKFVTTAGHDRSIRLWHRTQEPLVLDDERETEREKLADQVTNFI